MFGLCLRSWLIAPKTLGISCDENDKCVWLSEQDDLRKTLDNLKMEELVAKWSHMIRRLVLHFQPHPLLPGATHTPPGRGEGLEIEFNWQWPMI